MTGRASAEARLRRGALLAALLAGGCAGLAACAPAPPPPGPLPEPLPEPAAPAPAPPVANFAGGYRRESALYGYEGVAREPR
ncbi:hypothetical protein, partial [Paralimibaculum aggregatum]|uniref:hypothetical protein n=1 Tax=Paralimibaculum aggregatum TaxID=3036245 RepID=UPI0025546A7C